MSKHKESKPRLADWEARVALGVDGLVQTQEFPGTRWERDDRCFYTFTDEQGIVAEFAPGVVLSVIRKEPPVVVHPSGWPAGPGLEDMEKAAGPEILPVTPHGGK